MIPLGLTALEQAAFHATLCTHHTITVSVYVQDLNGLYLSNVSDMLLDGQVNVDADADITRSLTATFMDRSHAMSFDSSSPDDGALYFDRMLHVDYSVHVPALDRRVVVPVFEGPVTKFDRDGEQVGIEAQGKEVLGLNEIWRPLNIVKGANKVAAMRLILSSRAGETRFAMPTTTQTLPAAVALDRMAQAWPAAVGIATGMTQQLFYDGSGTCRLRVAPSSPVYTFRDGPRVNANITSHVQLTKDAERIKNTVWVQGGLKLGGKSGNASAVAVAPKDHPLSPQALARNGQPRHFVEQIQEDTVRTDAQARTLATSTLNDRLLDVTDMTCNALPVPHLDPLDVVQIQTGAFTSNIRLRKFSLPLSVTADMSLGAIQRVSVNRKRIRR